MKKILFLIAVALTCGALASCEKIYTENYSSIFRTGEDGEKICKMFTNFDLDADAGTLGMMVYYSGKWTAELTEPLNWASLDRHEGHGVETLRLTYTLNDTGVSRTAVIHIECDNGENVDICVNQATYDL